jgi:hypothetical protein
MTTNCTIDLENHRTPGAKIFTGRDRGEEVRISSKIDELADKYDYVKIIIPDNLFSINPSFFEELFVNVVTKYKEKGFNEKFRFENVGTYPYEKPLKEAINRILRENTALD